MRTFWFACIALLCASATAQAESLEQAYRTELQVLRAESAQLKLALDEAEASSTAARGALERDIDVTAAELVSVRAENAARGAMRPDPVDQAEQTQLLQLLDQVEAAAALQQLEVEPPAEGQLPSARFQKLVEASFARLSERGALRISRGLELFNARGVAQKADVLLVSEVAAVRWGDGYAPLVRTLDGSLRTMRAPKGHVATTGAGQSVTAVLFDPKEPPTQDHYDRGGMWQKMDAGGLMMWPLLVMAVVILLVALERLIGLSILGRRTARLTAALAAWRPPELGVGRVPPNVEANHWLTTPAVHVITAVGTPRDELEERAAQDLLEVRPRLMRRLSVLNVTAATAPLIGLLGTVTGMIGTFSVITDHGTGDPQLFAGGISEALLTTQLGLVVAIPALLMYSGLSRWASRLADTHQALVFDLVQRAGVRSVSPRPHVGAHTGTQRDG